MWLFVLSAKGRLAMLGWFRALLPREDKFFDLFERHSRILVAGAEALQKLLEGGEHIERYCKEIVDLEEQADDITREVMLAVRKSFITPFDRGDIKDLIQSMDDAIDMMHKVVKVVTLFEQKSFEPRMREMGGIIVEAALLTAEAIPLLEKVGANVTHLGVLAEKITQIEERADQLHDAGMKDLFKRHGGGDAMAWIIGSELYGHLEKVMDRFEDVANEISGIVIENV
jgi:predicted phosphate transport protein (TIGR00153 family)